MTTNKAPKIKLNAATLPFESQAVNEAASMDISRVVASSNSPKTFEQREDCAVSEVVGRPRNPLSVLESPFPPTVLIQYSVGLFLNKSLLSRARCEPKHGPRQHLLLTRFKSSLLILHPHKFFTVLCAMAFCLTPILF